MAEFSRYLPLSQRDQRDESAVTNNWSGHLATTLIATAAAVRSLDATQWNGSSVRPDVTIAELVSVEIAELSERSSTHDTPASAAHAADILDALASAAAARRRRTKLPALATAVLAAVDLATATGIAIHLDAIATGAVAIARGVRAPVGIREVLKETRFVAVDAEWSVGSGRIQHSTAAAIVLFLFARTGLPAPLETP
jgi:hypothetical protein